MTNQDRIWTIISTHYKDLMRDPSIVKSRKQFWQKELDELYLLIYEETDIRENIFKGVFGKDGT